MVTIAFLWPQAFAAPLASSSVTWIPKVRVLENLLNATVPTVEQYANWAGVQYADLRYGAVVAAAAMTNKNPAYAFERSKVPLRRHFKNTSMPIPDGSSMDVVMPYFDVNLRWIDASADNRSENAGNPQYQDVNQDYAIRDNGATVIIREAQWDAQKAMPTQAESFTGSKLVGVKIRTMDIGSVLPDGTIAQKDSPCPRVSEEFGQLPDVEQHQQPWIREGDTTVIAYDCYIFAEATITAAKTLARNCNVTSSTGAEETYATCFSPRASLNLDDDWLVYLSLDFMSEVLKYTVGQNYTQPWINDNLTEYTTGLLTLGYHAAWSGLMKRIGNASEVVTFKPTEPVVSASIDRTNLYIWLVLNATLTISALLVFVAQSLSTTKTIRDSTVAALTMDLAGIMCTDRGRGLCNAVSLSREDKKLPKLGWKDSRKESEFGERSCHRRVVFVDDAPSTMI